MEAMELKAGYTIRRAVRGDKDEIEKIWRESLGGMINWTEDLLDQLIRYNCVMVCELNRTGELVSAAFYENDNNCLRAEIYFIATKKKYRGQGYGKALLLNVIRHLHVYDISCENYRTGEKWFFENQFLGAGFEMLGEEETLRYDGPDCDFCRPGGMYKRRVWYK